MISKTIATQLGAAHLVCNTFLGPLCIIFLLCGVVLAQPLKAYSSTSNVENLNLGGRCLTINIPREFVNSKSIDASIKKSIESACKINISNCYINKNDPNASEFLAISSDVNIVDKKLFLATWYHLFVNMSEKIDFNDYENIKILYTSEINDKKRILLGFGFIYIDGLKIDIYMYKVFSSTEDAKNNTQFAMLRFEEFAKGISLCNKDSNTKN